MHFTKECDLALPYLAAVPCVPRAEDFLMEHNVFFFLLALDVGSSILAALADEKGPRLARPDLIVTKSAVLTVFVLAIEPCHLFGI